jgi:hypothetical protein
MSSGFQPSGFQPNGYQPSGYQAPSPFDPSFQQSRPKSGPSWLAGVLLIGLGLFFFFGIACSAGVWYVAKNIDKWIVTFGREAIVATIDDSDLPADQKKEIVIQVDRVVAAYKEGKLKQEDLQRVLGDLEESPAMQALVLYGIEDEFLTGTGLSEKEVQQGRRVFQRAVRGVYEGKINGDDFWEALPFEDEDIRPVSTKAVEKDEDAAVRELLVKLQGMADKAGIPDEPFEMNVAVEVKRLVDKALEGK